MLGRLVVDGGRRGGYDKPIMSEQEAWRGALEMVRRTMTARGRTADGYFSLEGVRLHERALRAGKRVEMALVGHSFNERQEPRHQALLYDLLLAGCQLVIVPDEVIGELAEGRDLGAIIGVLPFPEPPTLAEILAGDGRPLFLVGANIQDPGNTGALLRTGLAAGASAFIAGGVCDPFHPKAVRTSMGSLFKLPILLYDETLAAISDLQERGVHCLGLAVDGAVSLPQAGLPDSGLAVVAGSEAFGLTEAVRQALDQVVSIPMREAVDSFSVNAAAAIALYEIGRRWGEDVHG